MARPTRNNVEYFPHFTNARNGKTLKIIQRMFGNDGYAAFFKILEILGETDGHYYDYREFDDWIFLVAELGVSEERAEKILSFLSKSKTIDPELAEQKVIWSDNFVDGLSPVYAKRKRLSPQKPSFCDGNLVVEPVTAPESTQRKGKERKEEKRKKHIPDPEAGSSEGSNGMDRPGDNFSSLADNVLPAVEGDGRHRQSGRQDIRGGICPTGGGEESSPNGPSQDQALGGPNQQNSTTEGRVDEYRYGLPAMGERRSGESGQEPAKSDSHNADAASEGNTNQDGGRQAEGTGGKNLLPGITAGQPNDRVDGCDQRAGGADVRPGEGSKVSATSINSDNDSPVPGSKVIQRDIVQRERLGGVRDGGQSDKGGPRGNKKAGSGAAPRYRTKKNRWLTGQRLSDFEEFWKVFHAHGAKKNGKAPAADSWLDIKDYNPELVKWIIFAAGQYADERQDILQRNGTPKWAQGWLTDRRWEDYPMEEERPKKRYRTREEIFKQYGRKDLPATAAGSDKENAPANPIGAGSKPPGAPLQILFGQGQG